MCWENQSHLKSEERNGKKKIRQLVTWFETIFCKYKVSWRPTQWDIWYCNNRHSIQDEMLPNMGKRTWVIFKPESISSNNSQQNNWVGKRRDKRLTDHDSLVQKEMESINDNKETVSDKDKESSSYKYIHITYFAQFILVARIWVL